MKIGQLEVMPGEKKSGYLPVAGTEYELPVTVICGGEGKTTLITGGIHNAEYVGIQAAIELGQELQPEEINGTVVIVPLVNPSGFAHRTMSLVFEDGKNLNREFPGKADGTVGDRICHTVVTELFSHADYYIDLHCGDGYEELTPYVYYVGPVDEKVRSQSLKMAQCVDVAYIVESQCVTGGGYNYASGMGIPSVLLERGCMGKWSREEVEQDKKDLRRILGLLYSGKEQGREDGQMIFKKVLYEDAPRSGCWYPSFHAGEKFRAGEVLGEIKDCFGNTKYAYKALENGIMLYQTASLCVLEGGPMVAYGVLAEEKA